MSRGELEAIGNTGLLRGERPGRNYVTNNANSSPLRARQRLALDHTPEILVTVEVPKNIFPQPTRVAPQCGMSGGGMERMTTQPVPVLRIISISAGKKQ